MLLGVNPWLRAAGQDVRLLSASRSPKQKLAAQRPRRSHLQTELAALVHRLGLPTAEEQHTPLLGPLEGPQNPVSAGDWGHGPRQVPRGASLPAVLEVVLLLEILLLLLEEAILQSISAIRAARCLARSLVLLDGLVEAVQLAEQGHVQLSEADHLFTQQGQRGVQVGGLGGQHRCPRPTAASSTSAQLVLDPRLLRVEPLQVPPAPRRTAPRRRV